MPSPRAAMTMTTTVVLPPRRLPRRPRPTPRLRPGRPRPAAQRRTRRHRADRGPDGAGSSRRRRSRHLDRRDPRRDHRADRERLPRDGGRQHRRAADRLRRSRRRRPPDGATRHRSRPLHVRPRLARQLRRERHRGAVRPEPDRGPVPGRRRGGVHLRGPDVRAAVRGREHRAVPQHRPRAGGPGHLRGARDDRPPVEERRHGRDTPRDPAGSDRRPVPQLPDVLGWRWLRVRDEPRRLAQPRRTSDWIQRAGWRPPSCGRSGRQKASSPARCRRTS